jgi:Ribbon-helix-helix protein, copG family
MRQHMSIYLPPEMYERVAHEAKRRGLSLSAYVNAQLLTNQENFQRWLAVRLDRLEALFGHQATGAPKQMVTTPD